MSVSAWGQLFIQATAPEEAPVQVGSLWSDVSGTAVLKICTAVSPYTFSAVSGGSSSGHDRIIGTGETFTIADTESLVVAEYFAIEGTGVLKIEGDGALAVL